MDAKNEILNLIQEWPNAVRNGNKKGALANHTNDIVMFDVPDLLNNYDKRVFLKIMLT